jgi:hypothetical protein
MEPLSPEEVEAIPVCSVLFGQALFKIRLSRDGKRRSITRELVETERNYVDSLLIAEEVYYKPLDRSITSKNPLIDTPTLGQLFGCLDQIRATHQIILRAMDEVVPLLKTSLPDPAVYSRIATGILEVMPRLEQLYTSYLASNDHAVDILKKLKKGRKFKNFLCECLFNPRAKCHEIEDLLILPTQRIAGYKLLFERVLRFLPPETFRVQNDDFRRTLDSLLQMGASANAGKTDSAGQEKLLNVAESVTNLPAFMCIMKPSRKYVGSINVKAIDEATKKRTKAYMIFVLSDLVILCRVQEGGFSSGKLTFVDAIPISQVVLEACKVDKFAASGFVLKSDTERYPLVAKNAEKRESFIGTIKQMKKALVELVRRQTEDGVDFIQGLLAQLTQVYAVPQPPKTRAQALMTLH